MKWNVVLCIGLFVLVLFSAGCISQPAESITTETEQTNHDEKTVTEEEKPALQNQDTSPKATEIATSDSNSVISDKGVDDRYFYNIKIVAPADLEQLKTEITSDEYPIYNENNDLIGIVSPRMLPPGRSC